MPTRRDPRQVIKEAIQIARDYNLRVVEMPGHKGTDFVLYRKLPDGTSIRLGKRTSPAGIRSFVAKAANFR
jgi:hypothetical protein